ncbi:hypothetical protein [Campylobacter pinnipediorum]|uniref:hypothetical protein n=1 Tax=Campylobacter pinnipediorum TaxID=1965231 RepID=UPI0012FF951C|nr:hypothetical protein [Campylobacter pinnipediorum]
MVSFSKTNCSLFCKSFATYSFNDFKRAVTFSLFAIEKTLSKPFFSGLTVAVDGTKFAPL